VAGQHAAGTILWMANATAVADHVAPRICRAAADAGRAAPRIVAGLPVAVHDDVAEARAVAAEQFTVYGTLPNYQRILAHGGVSGPAEAAIVGDEASVTAQITALFEAGATDLWAAPFPVGPDPSASRARTRALLVELAQG
jgi:alkanesulfonate monooxygenase SsuD/methylene tetrahydromethanopterin reductase-like flavin-dependent oxidoreductase (luciferase family)